MCEQFIRETSFKKMRVPIDAPPNSLKDSNASSRVKTSEEKGIGVRSVVRNISGVKGAC
jgi:hypothetical protein